jgi:HEAT repeat protein
VTSPLEKTLKLLTVSHNEAAVAALIGALGQEDRAIHDGAIVALMGRRSKQGHLAVIGNLHEFSADQRQLLQSGRGHINGALRDAILSGDNRLFANACELVEHFTEIDLVPTLIAVAENPMSPHADQATQVVRRLVRQLSDILHSPLDDPSRRRTGLMRQHVLENLERCVERFRQHKRLELIEAFVILSGSNSKLLRSILQAPHHACFTPVLHTLTENQSPGVIGLLIEFLQTTKAPHVVTQVASHRKDGPFVAELMAQVNIGLSSEMRKNLKQIEKFAWLDPELDGSEERLPPIARKYGRQVVSVLASANLPRETLLKFLENMLHHGTDSGRLAACEALASIQGDWPNRLVGEALDDADPAVQTAAALLTRDRQISGSLPKLLALLDSPHKATRKAAREALQDLSFENFLSRFESLSDEVRRSTGPLVSRVDLEAIPQLQNELRSDSRSHRLRAIEMADVMKLTPRITVDLIERLQDEDHLVRASAASTLQACDRTEVRAALQESMLDPSLAVQNAARASLASMPLVPTMAPLHENYPMEVME